MKRLSLIIFAVILLTASTVFGAGTVTLSDQVDGNTYTITATCVGDASDGSIPDTDIDNGYYGLEYKDGPRGWVLYKVITNPGATAPDEAAVSIKDEDGYDLLGGDGATLIHASTTQTLKDLYQPIIGVITLDVDDQDTASATYVIRLIFIKGMGMGSSSSSGSGYVDINGVPVANDFARFTDGDTVGGRSYSEVRTDLGLVIGTDVQAYSADNALTTTKLDDFATPDDNTDLDATTSQHGLLPKLGGGTTTFLRADGTWAATSGSGTVDTSGTPATSDFARFTDADTIEGRSYAEARADLSLEPGTDVLAPDGDGSSLTSVDAATGDSATAFFDAGTIEHEYGGVEADVSAYTGLIGITGGATGEVDTAAELETYAGLGAYFNEYADDATANDVRTTLGLAIGTDVLAEQTIGISDNNLLEVDGTPNDDEYARFTASGLEGRTEAEFKADFNLEAGTDYYSVSGADTAFEAELDNSAGLLAALSDATGTGFAVFDTSPTFTTNITTPQVTLTGSDASPDAAGEMRYDSTITGMSGGGLRWYDDNSARIVVDLETDPSDDDYVVAYDAAADGFYMKEDATAGSPAWHTLGDAAAASEIDLVDYISELKLGASGDFRIGDGGSNYVKFGAEGAVTFVGTADIDLPTNSVDNTDINFNYAGSASEAGPASDLAATADTDMGDFDMLSIDKLEGYDSAISIDMGADGLIVMEADTGIQIGADGVQITDDSDGAITFLGLGNGSDEDLTLNFDDTANEVTVSSSTGVTKLNLSAMSLEADEITVDASATPAWDFNDSDDAGTIDASINVNCPTANDCDMWYAVNSGADSETIVFGVDTSDAGSSTFQMGDPGTNYWKVSEAGELANIGTATLNIAANTDLLIASGQIDYDDMAGTGAISTSGTAATGALTVTGTISTNVGLDAVGAVDMDYGSVDVTDHTFLTDSTGDAEIVFPNDSIGPAELVDDFTFETFPLTPSAAPDADYEVANKKYVDDNSGGAGDKILEGDSFVEVTDAGTGEIIIDVDDEDLEIKDGGANQINFTSNTGVSIIDFSQSLVAAGYTSDASFTATTSFVGPLFDAAGAEDMDYGSIDVTDHTFTTDDCTIILDGGITVSTGDTITLGSTAWNSGDSIDGEQIADNTIDVDSLDWGAFTDLGESGAVTWGNLAEGELADSTIISADIKDDTIDSADYAAASIDNEHLADDAVGTAEIATDAVTMDSVDADGAFTSLTGAWATTGLLSGGVVTKSTAASYTIGTTNAAESYGGVIYVTSAATITIPAVAAGMHFTVITIGATAVSVDPNASDLMYLDGTALDDGDKATNTSTTGDILVCSYYDATGWYCASGSNDGDLWTDGG